MTRIVAGAARGRRLVVPPGAATRPTSDRVREALFSAVEAELGALSGLRVLDLYAGSGALGLEALSRGAAVAVLVDRDAAAVRAARTNVEAVGLPGARVVQAQVERLAPAAIGADAPFDLVLADPPYSLAAADLAAVLSRLLSAGLLAPEALVVVERSARDPGWTWPAGLVQERHRRYGETALWYGRRALTSEQATAEGDAS